jgi:hypothetical protein
MSGSDSTPSGRVVVAAGADAGTPSESHGDHTPNASPANSASAIEAMALREMV